MTKTELKNWRSELGYTQAEAAEALGISAQHYRKLESGKHRVLRTTELACECLRKLKADSA